MKLELYVENSFKNDYKKILKNGFDETLLSNVVNKLLNKEPLESKYKDHKLQGDYKNYRDCHIKPDLVLIYKITNTTLYLVRIGSHSELF